ncbi:hypothetical protein ALC53_11406 [Atta colombica]|uniref:ER-bound oxygenase mpaB/mpaB'/Rubber oxygenase catalytic domain-containing protein n=1 Tax=Atta colombica TaxID=520822 RepID=A0A195B175_9HYME|nr:PREDICTED: uncharacterized protein LOC108691148 [Atta colombica]KYM78211.1 hypothetical protein ALC53_11406 [Atta colombica]
MKITSSETDSFIEENLLNDNDERAINDVMFKIKIREDKDNGFSSDVDSSLDNSDEWNNLLDSLINERKAFVTKCRQEFNNNKLPEYFDRWTIKQQYDHLISNISKYFPNIPESLRSILPAIFENGDFSEQRGNTKPDWLIMDKFYRGQHFAERHFSAIFMSQVMGLIQIFSFTDGMRTLIFSQESNTPYNAFVRYLRTANSFRNWYTSDPWCQGTPAYRDIQRVRRLHSAMRSKLCKKSFEEIDRDSKIQNVWCPILGKITKDFANTCPMAKSQQCPYTMVRTKSLNQGDMAGTLFSCMGLAVLYPEQFGIYASDEDLEAFCHLWRSLGYLLGIQDQYNFCRGNLQEIRQRSKDFIEYWVKPNFREVGPEWEHMVMCVFEGLVYIDLPSNYKVFILYLCDILELNMPRLYSSFSLLEKIFYALQKFMFSYMMKLPGVNFIINKMTNAYINRAATFKSIKHAKLKKKSSKIFEEFIPLKFDNRTL